MTSRQRRLAIVAIVAGMAFLLLLLLLFSGGRYGFGGW